MMTNKDISTTRGLVEFLKKEDDILVTSKEVDPVCEVIGVAKSFEDGPAVLFENVKGYPNHRILINVFGKRDRLAKIFGLSDPRKFKFKYLEATKNPIPPKVVNSAPCQEVVITEDIDVLKTMPVTQSIETDPGRIISGGISLISGPAIGHCVGYRRTFFQGRDWASMAINPASITEHFMLERRKENKSLPLTLNIGVPPAVSVLAAAGLQPFVVAAGTDELAIAGGLQGGPVEICKAKTVDAYAIADAEWVIEGYIDTSQVVWESDEAKRTGDIWQPFFIEWLGYQGWARQTYKFQATAITHKKDNPILYASVAHGLEVHTRMNEFASAAMYDMGDKICPGLIQDVNVLDCMQGYAGIVIQLKKRRRRDEGFARNLILAALGSCAALQMVIVVDEDVNIYSADDVLWAIMTRVDPKADVIAFGQGESKTVGSAHKTAAPLSGGAGKIGFDATVPFENKFMFYRGKHPEVNLEKWFSKEQINKVRAQQNEYARFLADNRL